MMGLDPILNEGSWNKRVAKMLCGDSKDPSTSASIQQLSIFMEILFGILGSSFGLLGIIVKIWQ